MFGRKPKPAINRKQMLMSTCVATRTLNVKRSKDGLVTLGVPLRAPPLLRKILGRHAGETSERDIELDEIGSVVWEMCDGKTTIRNMIQHLSERYKLNRKEAEVSLTAFIRSLAKKGLVAIIVPKKNET